MSKASERLDLTDERIDRVAKAVDANAREFDGRLSAVDRSVDYEITRSRKLEVEQRSYVDARDRELSARLGKLEQQPSGLGELGVLTDRVETLEQAPSALADVALHGRVLLKATGLLDLHEQTLAEVEQLASLTAVRLLRAEADIAIRGKGITQIADDLFTLQRRLSRDREADRLLAIGDRSDISRRLYALESIKNRGFRDRLWWLFFGE